MMTNLFSTFDPATSINMSFNWISTIIGMSLIPITFWITPSRYNMIFKNIHIKLHQEFQVLIGPHNAGFTLIFISLFTFILLNNSLGLLPYMFTSSSHLTYTLTLALPLWLSLMIFGWINQTQHMLAHLIPEGTPTILTPFMACIETISNIVRPGSLAIRLMANMIAGHLIMSLLGNNMLSTTTQMIPIIFSAQLMLMLFETAVSVIQAYVFSMLSTLYTSEVA
ncbi:ATP synthase F0 subunit 6 (mitochondrion) [Rhodnius prolixus]|uniref:ATP synthase subunit a n=1 Tax=Rhodnius prolixus TaxID=13249 RepID=A0A7D7JVU6_RHOPR|nr:ATP synthase F0 subunit 6 [Rhodnius prolixus]QMP96824.1 ATP synthase F0 subunit 6 [Rhodnius prolixus]